jgi:hypothetical protein
MLQVGATQMEEEEEEEEDSTSILSIGQQAIPIGASATNLNQSKLVKFIKRYRIFEVTYSKEDLYFFLFSSLQALEALRVVRG